MHLESINTYILYNYLYKHIHIIYIIFVSIAAKVFPGSLRLSDNFDPEMNDPTSKKFRDTAKKIEDGVRELISFWVFSMSL